MIDWLLLALVYRKPPLEGQTGTSVVSKPGMRETHRPGLVERLTHSIENRSTTEHTLALPFAPTFTGGVGEKKTPRTGQPDFTLVHCLLQ